VGFGLCRIGLENNHTPTSNSFKEMSLGMMEWVKKFLP